MAGADFPKASVRFRAGLEGATLRGVEARPASSNGQSTIMRVHIWYISSYTFPHEAILYYPHCSTFLLYFNKKAHLKKTRL
ncbi:MAG: hypothetical protein LBD58_12880 [Treponema sp.]|jgi:hypothetical protein|nr:hypothetical protein [Treponema sp.]